ncbi:hypothetical protein ACEWY4_004152 [Coilia grayii]|uniref:Uncharacterized protein n=1 Tax=Coilia grayii TaxID=363190 RepID=A0ABD1KKY6_9TELE
MQPEQVTALEALQIPSQPMYLLTSHVVEHDSLPQGQSQLSPPLGTSSQAPCMVSVLPATCSRLEVSVVVFLLTAAAVAILVLLYWVLLLRHRLKVAQARHAVEYWGFFRSARYNLKEPGLPEAFPLPVMDITPAANGVAPHATDSKPQLSTPPPPPEPPAQPPSPPPYSESASCQLSASASSGFSPPCSSTQLQPPQALPSPAATKRASPAPSPVLRPTSTPTTIPFPSLPRPLHPLPPPPTPPRPLSAHPHPYIYTSPPSPYLSWGACSDVDVYASVGSIRLSRTSSGSQTQVILFEHSAL